MKLPPWVLIIAALALVELIVGIHLHGYRAKPGWVGVADKKFWDYLDLLIVPGALAIGVYWLNWAQSEREREAEVVHQQREDEAEQARRDRELELETQRAQDAALLAYLDRMDDMLLRLRETTRRLQTENPKNPTTRGLQILRMRRLQTEDPTIHALVLADTLTLIRTRTLTMLEPLDGRRKGVIMRLLSESGLLDKDDKEESTTIDLRDADFSSADLKIMNLTDHDLQRVSFTNANLAGANLSGTNLRAADLSGADLRGANLRAADLRGADLRYSNLSGATEWTEEQLTEAEFLEGTTMPNDEKYEEWLKSKGRGEDGEHPGPS